MRVQLAHPDKTCAQIAARQHGVISFRHLLDAGLTQSGVDRRLGAGRLHRVYRGVYAWGHSGLSNEGRWLAAVLACGEGAVLSYRSAAELWGLLKVAVGPIHVSLPKRSGRAHQKGLVIHRPSSLPEADRTRENRIGVTTVARTIRDLRRTAPAGVVRQALRQANYEGLELGNEEAGSGERGELERRFLRFLHRNGLPLPAVNVKVGIYTVDFLWRRFRLVVETDDWQGHQGRQAFEDDRARDAYLKTRGFEVVRITWRQLEGNPGSVLALLRRYLRDEVP
jgi:predicted transcriptional regulator of viral defense system